MHAFPPPRGPWPPVPIAAALVVAALLGWPAPSRADIVGFRIDGRACRGATCRDLPGSPALWRGRYVCQDRAALLQDLARTMPSAAFGLGHGIWTITARCVAVQGLSTA